MGCPVPVYCRHCNEALDVYQPFEERFCSDDCADANRQKMDARLQAECDRDLANAISVGKIWNQIFHSILEEHHK